MAYKNLLFTGDWHTTEDVPRNRIDLYTSAMLAKLVFIFSYARKHKCIILQPGDFFDKSSPSYQFFSAIVSLLKAYYDVGVITIYGQHDMKYRRKENTALGALECACSNLTVLDSDKVHTVGDEYAIYGCGYGEEIPKPILKNKKSILLIHKMVVKKKLWAGQKDFVYAKDLLKDNAFDIIVSGDNHTSFTEIYNKKKMLFNCGGLMRSTIIQIDHTPVMYKYVSDNNFERIYIPINNNVFDENKMEKDKERNQELEAFVEGLSSHKEMGLNFEDNLNVYFKENKVDEDVQKFIIKCLRR